MDAQGIRLAWEEVAGHIREEVASVLGSAVVAAANEPGGFSPGVAARCRLADGRRYFVKAVSAEQNRESPHMHRREGKVASTLPAGLPIPELVATIDDGHWVVLVFEEVDGVPPRQPWTMEELAATFAAVDALAAETTPCPVAGLASFAKMHAHHFDGYRRLAGGDPLVRSVDPWTGRHLDRLAEFEARYPAASAGETLLHSDLRADNLLVRPDGSVVIVDRPHACVGAAWVDKALMLPSAALGGGPTPAEVEEALDRSRARTGGRRCGPGRFRRLPDRPGRRARSSSIAHPASVPESPGGSDTQVAPAPARPGLSPGRGSR